jgi:hypothetical protein
MNDRAYKINREDATDVSKYLFLYQLVREPVNVNEMEHHGNSEKPIATDPGHVKRVKGVYGL